MTQQFLPMAGFFRLLSAGFVSFVCCGAIYWMAPIADRVGITLFGDLLGRQMDLFAYLTADRSFFAGLGEALVFNWVAIFITVLLLMRRYWPPPSKEVIRKREDEILSDLLSRR